MSIEFLKRLFMAATEEPSNGLKEGLNLSELYERIEDTEREDAAFSGAVKSTGLDCEQCNDLEIACCNVNNAYELQGFINGFRLCAQLGKELAREQAQHTYRTP